MCRDNRQSSCGTSGQFLVGLIFGAAIGAFLAIVIYRNRRSEVITTLQSKISDFIKDTFPPWPPRPTKKTTAHKPPSSPKSSATKSAKSRPKKTSPKMFVR